MVVFLSESMDIQSIRVREIPGRVSNVPSPFAFEKIRAYRTIK